MLNTPQTTYQQAFTVQMQPEPSRALLPKEDRLAPPPRFGAPNFNLGSEAAGQSFSPPASQSFTSLQQIQQQDAQQPVGYFNAMGLGAPLQVQQNDGPLTQAANQFMPQAKAAPLPSANMFDEPSRMQQLASTAKEQGMDRQEYLLLRRAQRNFRRQARGRRGSGEAALAALDVARQGRELGYNMVGAYDHNQRKQVIQTKRAEADRLASNPRRNR